MLRYVSWEDKFDLVNDGRINWKDKTGGYQTEERISQHKEDTIMVNGGELVKMYGGRKNVVEDQQGVIRYESKSQRGLCYAKSRGWRKDMGSQNEEMV